MLILVIYDYFTPAYKAGGPIQSIQQIVRNLSINSTKYIFTSAYDLGSDPPFLSVQKDQWVNGEYNTKIYYNTKDPKISNYQQIFSTIKPQVIYINGLFSFRYNILAILAGLLYKRSHKSIKLLVAPRGMMHPAALTQKRLKKIIFLTLFKLFGVSKKLHWHATDFQEAEYIRSQFGNVNISIASNFPNYLEFLKSPFKEKGSLILGTIALISPMKNHLEVLKSLKTIPYNITWHIFGPVKDTSYWKDCESFIRTLPEHIKVEVHGPVTPNAVSEALEKIQVFILPSKSENFGHAILEALSAGKPVITTDTTPFTDLTEKNAGITISIHSLSQSLSNSIQQFADMSQQELETYQIAARNYALSRFDTASLIQDYERLFTSQ